MEEKEVKKLVLDKAQWDIIYAIYRRNASRDECRPGIAYINIKPDKDADKTYFTALDGFRMSIYEAKGALDHEVNVRLPALKVVGNEIEISTPDEKTLSIKTGDVTYLISAPTYTNGKPCEYINYEKIKPDYDPEKQLIAELDFSVNYMIDQLSLLKKNGENTCRLIVNLDQGEDGEVRQTVSPMVFKGIESFYSLLLPIRMYADYK